jgi:hypothetical protein
MLKPVHYWLFAAFCAALAMLLYRGSRVENRRRHTLQALRWTTRNEELLEQQDLLPNAVARATSRSLKKPDTVYAGIWPGQRAKTNGFVLLYWVSDFPKANGLLFVVNGVPTKAAAFDTKYAEDNEKAAKEVVMFDAMLWERELQSLWSLLSTTQAIRVLLAKDGQPVSHELALRRIERQSRPSN